MGMMELEIINVSVPRVSVRIKEILAVAFAE